MIYESLLKRIEDGRSGKNQGYSMGMPKLESVIDGVIRQNQTVVFSDSGSGKSSFMLYCYVYRPLMEHLDDDNYRVVMFSLEMNADMIFAKLLSTYLFETYGVELTVKDILSRRKGHILDDASYDLIKKSADWMKKMESHILIHDKAINAKSMYAVLYKDLEKYGTFSETTHRKTYQFNNPDLIYSVIIDHIGLVRPTDGRTLKQEVDETSAYLLTLRNICGISPVIVQQANREHGNIERRKQGMSGFSLTDTKNSGNPIEDAETVISLYNPNREKLRTYRGYDIATLGNNFRMISVLKSRYGDSDVEIGCNFFGGINIFKELPKACDIYNITKYTNYNYLLNKEDNQPKEEDKVTIKPTFKI